MADDITSANPAPLFLGDRPRSHSVRLEWPVEYMGTRYEAITVRRLTTAEVAAFMQKVAEHHEANPEAADEVMRFPIFFDERGEPVPDEVMDGLDDDDAVPLNEAAVRFLPRRFRAATEPTSTPQPGEATGPTSAS
jgi:hypothetical protein